MTGYLAVFMVGLAVGSLALPAYLHWKRRKDNQTVTGQILPLPNPLPLRGSGQKSRRTMWSDPLPKPIAPSEPHIVDDLI